MTLTRERVIPLLFIVAIALDYLFPITAPGAITGAWIVPAIMGATALIGALKGKRQEKNNAKASRYQAEVQAERDRYEAAMSKAKRGERLRFGNAFAKSRGFVIPEFDPSTSEGVNLVQPKIPEFKSGGFLEALGAGLGGVGSGIMAESEMNTRRGSLPASPEEAGPPSELIVGGSPSADAPPSLPLGTDPYAAVLGGTDYFGGVIPRYRSNLGR